MAGFGARLVSCLRSQARARARVGCLCPGELCFCVRGIAEGGWPHGTVEVSAALLRVLVSVGGCPGSCTFLYSVCDSHGFRRAISRGGAAFYIERDGGGWHQWWHAQAHSGACSRFAQP